MTGKDELKVAIGGLGAIGMKVARTLDEGGIPGCRLVAVSAGDKDRARQRIADFNSPPDVTDLAGLAEGQARAGAADDVRRLAHGLGATDQHDLGVASEGDEGERALKRDRAAGNRADLRDDVVVQVDGQPEARPAPCPHHHGPGVQAVLARLESTPFGQVAILEEVAREHRLTAAQASQLLRATSFTKRVQGARILLPTLVDPDNVLVLLNVTDIPDERVKLQEMFEDFGYL